MSDRVSEEEDLHALTARYFDGERDEAGRQREERPHTPLPDERLRGEGGDREVHEATR